MRTKLTDAALYAALLLTLAVIAFATSAVNASIASAYTLGAADGTTDAAPLAAQLGARTYRVVLDSRLPLESYASRIDTYRAYGMRPQLVIDGNGTGVRGKSNTNWPTINYAIHAFRRWPDTYSVSILNEPDLSGMSACNYARTFRHAYRMLKRAGVPRVLFGEFSPQNPLGWTAAIAKCTNGDVIADGWAWHGYDYLPEYYGVNKARTVSRALKSMRRVLHTRKGAVLPMFLTEYGVTTRGDISESDAVGARRWSTALRTASRLRFRQVVAWQIAEAPEGSRWDTSLVRSDGSRRPAFATIASTR